MKPEMWQDEKISSLSRDARLLFVGLMSMADDEGRFRARRTEIIGWVFPDDDDAFELVDGWIAEIKGSELIVFYVHDGRPYGAFRNWRKHQKINKPTASELPSPPDRKVVRANSVRRNGELRDNSRSSTGDLPDSSGSTTAPHADQIRSDQINSVFTYWQQRCSKSRAKLTDERRSKVNARLEQGYSLEDIKLGIDGAALNPPVTDGVTHDDLMSICRNGAQLERYVERATAVKSIEGGKTKPHIETTDEVLARRGVAA